MTGDSSTFQTTARSMSTRRPFTRMKPAAGDSGGVLRTGKLAFATICLFLTGCASSVAPNPGALTVAAASNLTRVMNELAGEFEKESGVRVIISYGSTAQLAQQIEHG